MLYLGKSFDILHWGPMKVGLCGECGLGSFSRRLHDVVSVGVVLHPATLPFLVSAVRNKDDHSVRDGAVSGSQVKSPLQSQTLCQVLSNETGLNLTRGQHMLRRECGR